MKFQPSHLREHFADNPQKDWGQGGGGLGGHQCTNTNTNINTNTKGLGARGGSWLRKLHRITSVDFQHVSFVLIVQTQI